MSAQQAAERPVTTTQRPGRETRRTAFAPPVLVEQRNGTARLVLSGELDLGDADELNHAVTHLVAWPVSKIDVEMRQLDFIDTNCLGVLVRLGWEAHVKAKRVRVLHPSPPVALVLRLTGLDRSLGLTRAT